MPKKSSDRKIPEEYDPLGLLPSKQTKTIRKKGKIGHSWKPFCVNRTGLFALYELANKGSARMYRSKIPSLDSSYSKKD